MSCYSQYKTDAESEVTTTKQVFNKICQNLHSKCFLKKALKCVKQNIHSVCFWDFPLPTALWKFSLITWRRNAFQPKVWSFPSIFTHSLNCGWSSEGNEKSGKGLLYLGRFEWWLIIDETLQTRKWIHNNNSSSLAIDLQQLDYSLRIALTL